MVLEKTFILLMRLRNGFIMAESKRLNDKKETRKKIADDEFREIVKIAQGHKKTLSALARR